MKKTIEMPIVQACPAHSCAFNDAGSCHAKAITVGDGLHAACDTYFGGAETTSHTELTAGVGACKVSRCRYNDSLECQAPRVEMGKMESFIECTTFAP